MLLKKIKHDNSLHFQRLALVFIISTTPVTVTEEFK